MVSRCRSFRTAGTGPGGCGVVPASMTYVDHQGVTHTINYLNVSNLSQCDNG